MADRRYTLEEALAMLREEAKNRVENLLGYAARLEDDLRLGYEARAPRVVTDASRDADVLHVFEAQVMYRAPAGTQLELSIMGQRCGHSLIAPPIEQGRYRVVLALTKLPDEPPR